MTADSLWLPQSRCGRHCLPLPGAWPTAAPIRRAARITAALSLLVATVAVSLMLPAGRVAARRRLARLSARSILRALGVRHGLRGRPPLRSALVVANHVSWLDILVLVAHVPVRVVAKREVRRWPVVGALATAFGAFYIDRSSPRALPSAVADVAAALREGFVVAVFPEATTFCGTESGPFRPAMFQAAIDARAMVAPMSLRFQLAHGSTTTVAAFVGDEGLLSSLRRVASVRGLTVTVRVHSALHPERGASRRVLARAARAALPAG